jgi:Uma2 family endonuclease
MNLVRRQPEPVDWTVDAFLAWEDRQEGKHEFDGRHVILMTGGSRAHQRIIFNLLTGLTRGFDPERFDAVQEMRILVDGKVRYPDVCLVEGRIDPKVGTLSDATVIFEVLSGDTVKSDRVDKLAEYATLPSIRCYILLEQTAIAATVFRRERGPGDRIWVARAVQRSRSCPLSPICNA